MSTRDTHRAEEQIAKLPDLQVGREMQSAKATLSGSSPHALTFAGLGLEAMADNAYTVFVGGTVTAFTKVDEATMTTSGFSLVGASNTNVVHLLIHGNIASRNR